MQKKDCAQQPVKSSVPDHNKEETKEPTKEKPEEKPMVGGYYDIGNIRNIYLNWVLNPLKNFYKLYHFSPTRNETIRRNEGFSLSGK